MDGISEFSAAQNYRTVRFAHFLVEPPAGSSGVIEIQFAEGAQSMEVPSHSYAYILYERKIIGGGLSRSRESLPTLYVFGEELKALEALQKLRSEDSKWSHGGMPWLHPQLESAPADKHFLVWYGTLSPLCRSPFRPLDAIRSELTANSLSLEVVPDMKGVQRVSWPRATGPGG